MEFQKSAIKLFNKMGFPKAKGKNRLSTPIAKASLTAAGLVAAGTFLYFRGFKGNKGLCTPDAGSAGEGQSALDAGDLREKFHSLDRETEPSRFPSALTREPKNMDQSIH